MKEPLWLTLNEVLAFHERMIAEFGGSAGVRDGGLLESALGKPKNLFAYSNDPNFPQSGHGNIKLAVLFNDPMDLE